MDAPRILTYQTVWTKRNRDGDMQYEYHCTWSDGTDSMEVSLPWDRMEGAVQLPATSLSEIEKKDGGVVG